MTNNNIEKYLSERNYQLTTKEVEEVSQTFQVIGAEYTLGGRMCKICTNCNKDFLVMIKDNED